MIKLGLTGSIGMGKSTTAKIFQDRGVPVYDADAIVHSLYRGAGIEPIADLFPNVIVNGQIDRKLLSKEVVDSAQNMQALEDIVHPMVHAAEAEFCAHHKQKATPLVLLDIPLLFEGNRQNQFDKILVVSAPFEVQKERVLSRSGMTEDKFKSILARQVPDERKRQLADYIIDTSLGMEHAKQQVDHIIVELTQ